MLQGLHENRAVLGAADRVLVVEDEEGHAVDAVALCLLDVAVDVGGELIPAQDAAHFVGGQAGITNDVAPGSVLWGTPAHPLSEARREAAAIRRLPDLLKRVRALEEEIRALRGEST